MAEEKIDCKTCKYQGKSEDLYSPCVSCEYLDSFEKHRRYPFYEPKFLQSDTFKCTYCGHRVNALGVCPRCGAKYRTQQLAKADGTKVAVGVIQEQENKADVVCSSFHMTKQQESIYGNDTERVVKGFLAKKILDLLLEKGMIDVKVIDVDELYDDDGKTYEARLRILHPDYRFGEE